ncbi:integrase family protein [Parasalinivibrio latis]|uniref:gamma-mobile-trio integrase GmtZ n=1 Tax=Parasalinivibrio latis TaxID=2952610 RepID=UPI0030DE3243
MKSTDYEFQWFTDKNGSGWETWRELASTWLHGKKYGIDHKRNAIARFLDEYLVSQFITDPVELFDLGPQDYAKFLHKFELSEGYRVRQNNEVCSFIDWIIEKYYSQPDDNGDPVGMFKNPFLRSSNPVNKQETAYNTLPFYYIKKLRNILCPRPRGNLSDWTWAIEQSDLFMHNGRHTRDWFIVSKDLIDEKDPDCVWRKVTLDKDRQIRVDGSLRRFNAGDSYHVLWSPVRAMTLYMKLQLPLRTYQVRMLDSGEADTWRYDKGQWIPNKTNEFVEGSEKRPWQKGVIHRLVTPDIGDVMTGLYINTNKTADRNKDEISRGYVIPWENEDVLYWLEKLRNWQEKYNPISLPTSIHELDYKHFGSTKSDTQRDEIGNICFLFRHASSPLKRERKLPITSGVINTLWIELLRQLEENTFKAQQTLTDGSKVRFIDPINPRKSMFPLHSLRVSLITCYTLEGDIPTPVLSKLLVGHTRLIMTLHYTKVTAVMMARKMKQAEEKISANDEESLQTFLANKSIQEIGLQASYNDIEALQTILRVRNPAGWQEKSIGVCLAGGNTSSLPENVCVPGCWNGGERLKRANRNQSDLYGPVPHGLENCVRCRWFITDLRYLPALSAHFNNLSYHASEAAKLAAELEQQLSLLLDEEYFCEIRQQAFVKHEEVHALERRLERQQTDADEYCKDLVACFQIIRKIVALEGKREQGDNKEKIVAIGSEEEISPFFGFLDTESEFRQLIQLCDDAEVFADLRDDLRKSSAIAHRSNTLNVMLMKSGYIPFLLQLDAETQLLAGNAMVNAMIKAMDESDKNRAMTKLAGYLDAEAYLHDAGLLEAGVRGIEAKTGINILRLSDLSRRDSGGIENNG